MIATAVPVSSAAVAIASTVFVACVGFAIAQKSIETTPEQVKKAAALSDSNLNRHEDRESILRKLEVPDRRRAVELLHERG